MKTRLGLAQLANSIGDGAFLVCSALYFTRVIGLSPAQVGLALTLGWAAGFVAGVPLGHLADRKGPRGVAVALALTTAAAVASFLFAGTGPAFLASVIVYGVAQAAVHAAAQPRHSTVDSAAHRGSDVDGVDAARAEHVERHAFLGPCRAPGDRSDQCVQARAPLRRALLRRCRRHGTGRALGSPYARSHRAHAKRHRAQDQRPRRHRVNQRGRHSLSPSTAAGCEGNVAGMRKILTAEYQANLILS